MKVKTLKIELFKNLALPITLSIIIIAAAGYWSSSNEISEVYDSQLITSANVLWLVNKDDHVAPQLTIKMEARNADLDQMDQAALDEYAKWRSFRVWKNTKLVIASDNARPESVPPAQKGFSDTIIEGKRWRIFSLYIPEENSIVEVAENQESRSDIISNILTGLLWPLLFAFPVIAFLIWKGIHRGLKGLHRFAYEIKERSPDDLSRIIENGVVGELLPLTEGINQLLGKLETSLIQERLFTDNAAHELRTPLAVLQAQTQVILYSNDATQREEAVRELAKGTKRASRLLDQLLTLAQLRHQPMIISFLNLYAQAREVIKTSFANAAKKHIEINLSGNEALMVKSQNELLLLLIGNIVDNAIKYTPEEGSLSLLVGETDGNPSLRITDTGPGIPVTEQQNVFQRFYRLPDNKEAGSGLGLAIAKQIAELLHIDIRMHTPDTGSGLAIDLVFMDNM